MKKLTLAQLVIASLVAVAGSAMAAGPSVGADFTVSATLAAKCESTTTGTPDINFGEYTAFGSPANLAPTATLSFKCTRNLAITNVALSSTSGTLKGVDYTLAIGSDTGAPAAANVNAPDTHVYQVTGTMAPNQAGDVNDTTVQQTRTLTISF